MADPSRQPDDRPSDPTLPAAPAAPPPAPQASSLQPQASVNPTVRRERLDIRLAPLLVVAVVVVAFCAFHFWWVWRYFEHREAYEDQVKASTYPLAPSNAQSLPKQPRLDPLDELSATNDHDFRRLQLEREKRLTTFGPTNDKGFVHIPIDEAMRRIAEQTPKPKSAAADDEHAFGLKYGGGPNSGRVFQESGE